jgi:putative pyruvate formate lyase activating enzyme
MPFKASYLLLGSGELEGRAGRLEARLEKCDICPRKCGSNRLKGEKGFCRSGALAVVSSACDHHGEEPALSGTRGSGTIFFGNCNLKCVFCQNHQISQPERGEGGRETDAAALAGWMIYLQDKLGCHNINLVSPSHFVPQIVRALMLAAAAGLKIPLVYNTNAYDSPDTLHELDGIVDIYLPDIKYADDRLAMKYSQAKGYVAHSRAAISEMYRQAGDLVTDENGVAQRGIIVRHLILPNDIAGSEDSLAWLAKEVSPAVTVSVMAQYYPSHRARKVPLLSRKISYTEYRRVVKLVEKLGLENGWVQDMAAPENYLPDFDRPGHPFKPGRGS